MKFSEMPYSRPDLKEQERKTVETVEKLRNAKSAQEQLDAYKAYDEYSGRFHDMLTLSDIRHSIDTRDPFYSAENDYANEIGPSLQELNQRVSKALLESPFRPELEKHLGKLAFKNMEIRMRTFKPEIMDLMLEENRLQSEYQKLYASAMVSFDGKELPLPQLGPYMESLDRSVRRAAYEVQGQWFDSHQEELDSIFDRLVKNRNAQGRAMGYENYIPLIYDRMGRNCYGPKEVAAFREQIATEIVPLVTRLKTEQAKRLGVDKITVYDSSLLFPDGNPVPQGSANDILAAGRQMYQELSPETAEFGAVLFDDELLDVLSKEGKAPGGYCTSLHTYKVPFIFANFNGTSGDVDVLTHEGGHAFEFYRSERKGYFSCQTHPTAEICESHSMSMEFLTAPWHNKFFGAQTDKYAFEHCADSLTFLPYGCMIDEFQHLAYENADWTPQQRNEAWLDLEKKYRPWMHSDGLPFYTRGATWQRQLHIYTYPFYYIDYCMAQVVAFQFWIASMADFSDAWKRYLHFVDASGTKTFEEVVTDAGLQVPYTPGCMKRIGAEVFNWLSSHNV